ncbi:MAG: VCBS repeat-containing protein [Synoicihabitans sp.]
MPALRYFLVGITCALVSSAELIDHPLTERSTGSGETRFTRLSPEASGLTVPNVFNDPRMWGDRFREYTLGALETGLAVADFNNDGRLDIYAISKNGPNALYIQTQRNQFEDRAAAAAVAGANEPAGQTGATAVDINQDGWVDIYVSRLDAPNLLFINQGDATFREEAEAYGLAIRDASVHASFADYDRDGDLDLYLCTNILDFSRSPTGQPDYLMRNNGDGTFEDVSLDAGIWGKSQGHTAIWFDANRDGWPDLYVANDFETPDRFYFNNGDGTFTDVVDERLPHVTYFSMGADAGDLNNDGEIDFLVADMRDHTRAEFMAGMEEMGRGLWENERVAELIPQYTWNAVYLGTGTDRFEEVAHLTGMQATGWTWAARIADLDLNGHADVFYTNGMLRNFIDADLVDKQNIAPNLAARARVWRDAPKREEPNLAYRNDGHLNFSNVSKEWGLDHHGVSFGAVVADMDNDGDLDLVYANLEGPPTLMRNDTVSGNRVVVQLQGKSPNRHAIGAEIRVQFDDGELLHQVYSERGVVSSELAPVVFGLGSRTEINEIEVRWPDGSSTTHANPPINRRLVIRAASATAPHQAASPATPPLLTETAASRGLTYVSDAYPLEELARQRLLPRRLGQTAPAIAVADVNGDEHPDVFVSGARGQSGQLFLTDADQNFSVADAQPWQDHEAADDTGAVFLDANHDGHLDLFISAGGVEPTEGDDLLHDRIYWGNGTGAFSPAESLTDGTSTTAVAMTQHGDKTLLFVGGRSIPGEWPKTPRSFLYATSPEGLIAQTIPPALENAGMVTAATWGDLDADGDPDLVLTTEWGSVKYFENESGGLIERTSDAGLAELTGWWSAVALADANNDGRLDIIAGNVGLNTKYQASADFPATLFAGDLDGSGKFEILEARYDDDKELYPVRGLSKLSYSFRRLRRSYRTFARFAEATVYDLFSSEKLDHAMRLEATEFRSGVFVQQADGRFDFSPLSIEAQMAPVHGIGWADLNGDDHQDLIIVGNDFSPEPSTGRFDGSLGRVMLGDGRGNFTPLSPARSGLSTPGDTRALAVVTNEGRTSIITADAMGPVRLFETTAAADRP